MLLRQLYVIHEGVRGGGWPKPPGHSFGGLRLGVIGLGVIGRAVVRRGVVAQMDVVGSDPMPESQAAAETDGSRIMEIDELTATSHVVSVNAPLNDSTRHLVNAGRLQSMPAGGYLVNTGRGEVVDTAALAAVLRFARLAGAAAEAFLGDHVLLDSATTPAERAAAIAAYTVD